MRVIWAGTFDPDFPRNRKLARLLAFAGIEPIVVREAVWNVDRVALATKGRGRIALTALFRYPKLLFRLLAHPRPDLYLVSYPGWFDVPIVRLVASIKGRAVVFDPFLSLYDTMITDRHLHSERSLVARLSALFDRWSLRLADVVIADTAAQLDMYVELAGGLRREGAVLPVGADDDVFAPRSDTKIDLNFVLFYGSLVPLHGIETIVEAAALLEREGIRTVIIGDGQDRPTMEEAIERSGASVELHGLLPLDELPQYIAKAVVCLGVFGDSEKANRVVPHKVYECLAMGRPVVTRDGHAIRSLFQPGEVVTVPPTDPGALAEAVLSLVKDPEVRERVAQAGLDGYRQRFHEEPLADLLISALKSAVH